MPWPWIMALAWGLVGAIVVPITEHQAGRKCPVPFLVIVLWPGFVSIMLAVRWQSGRWPTWKEKVDP